MRQGGKAVVRVSSRREREPQHLVTLLGVPIADAEASRRFQMQEPCCPNTQFTDFAYWHKPSDQRSLIDAHGIAAAMLVAKRCASEGNNVPARYMPFPVPSQRGIDFYRALTERTFKKVVEGGKDRYQHLTQAEEWVLMGAQLQNVPFSQYFGNGRGKLADRNWTM
jgi:hypothetical protein